MLSVGNLRQTRPDNLSQFSGQIQTPDVTLNILLEGDELLCDTAKPSHQIFTRNRTGAIVPIGSAWLKTIQRGESTGKRFFTLSIDYPGLPAPLNVAAFPSGTEGEWNISWRRREPHRAAAAAE